MRLALLTREPSRIGGADPATGASIPSSPARFKEAGLAETGTKITEIIEKVGQLLEIPERKSYRVLLKVTINGRLTTETFYCSSQNISASGILIETEKTLCDLV